MTSENTRGRFALWLCRCRLICCRTFISLRARLERRHFSALIFSNVKLPSRIGLTAILVVSHWEFCVPTATGVNDSGSVDSTLIQSMGRKVRSTERISFLPFLYDTFCQNELLLSFSSLSRSNLWLQRVALFA